MTCNSLQQVCVGMCMCLDYQTGCSIHNTLINTLHDDSLGNIWSTCISSGKQSGRPCQE